MARKDDEKRKLSESLRMGFENKIARLHDIWKNAENKIVTVVLSDHDRPNGIHLNFNSSFYLAHSTHRVINKRAYIECPI